MRDSEGMTLVDGDTRQGTAYVSFERKHRIARYPFTPRKVRTADRHGAVARRGQSGWAPIAASRRWRLIRAGKLKGTLLAFAERLADKNGNLRGWLIGGPTPGGILLKRIGRFRHHRHGGAARRRHRRAGAALPLQRGHQDAHPPHRREASSNAARCIEGEVLLDADDSLNIDNMEAHRRPPRGVGRDRADADVGRQFQRAAAHADHAVHAA